MGRGEDEIKGISQACDPGSPSADAVRAHPQPQPLPAFSWATSRYSSDLRPAARAVRVRNQPSTSRKAGGKSARGLEGKGETETDRCGFGRSLRRFPGSHLLVRLRLASAHQFAPVGPSDDEGEEESEGSMGDGRPGFDSYVLTTREREGPVGGVAGAHGGMVREGGGGGGGRVCDKETVVGDGS